MDKLKVIFRKFKDGDIIALLPDLAGNNNPNTCESYQHVGQHGAANYSQVIAATRPATPEEFAPLLREFRNIYESGPDPVKLVVRNRASASDRAARIKEINN